MSGQVKSFGDALEVADMLIERLHGHIVMALPLGLGKANRIANAVYARAADDQAISLTILTALTLTAPRGKIRLEQRFIDPIRERVFGGYPELAYALALQRGELKPNIQVHEFFLPAGQSLRVASSQQNFISSNYTQAAETLIERGLNVVAQMVARHGDTISLGSNADLTPDLLRARQAGTADFMLVGEVNQAMPFMQGEAELPISTFDGLLEGPQCVYPLFAPPKPAVTMADYAAGVWIASLIPDGGTLQIGIGSIGDAVARLLILRHTNNPLFRDILAHLSASAPEVGHLTRDDPFAEGLFGLSEMLVDSFLPLIDAGVIKREVDGALMQTAFFLGPRAFYQRLHDMTDDEHQRIQMRPVSWVNSL